jgi:phosphoenolpyruvate-protein phosphotransferase (PTS system enzyme I)
MADANAEKRIRRLVGLGVSRGVGRGNVVFLHPGSKPLVRTELNECDIDHEISRFRAAVATAKRQLLDLARTPTDKDEHAASDIFSVQVLILESSLTENTEKVIREKKINAEWALKRVLREYADRHATLPEGHIREKLLDIEDVANRIARVLRGGRSTIPIGPHAVVVARELRPSSVMELAKHQPAGIITETGGWTSHMSIIARECHLPMVAGIRNVEQYLSTGDLVIVDGDAGEVRLDGDAADADRPKGKKPAIFSSDGWPSRAGILTADGVEVIVRANLESVKTYKAAKRLGAKGIGLYRSESLVSDHGHLPTEEEQFAAYAEIAAAVGEPGVAIRTFDIPEAQLSGREADCEANPALGLRAIRSGLAKPDLLRSQIRAILRASTEGRIDIILPMISNVRQELLKGNAELAQPRIGVMVEVPSAVLSARQMAKHADFLCLGTNDLVQYLLAVDRDNVAVADWYQTLNPAVLSAIKLVLAAAEAASIPTITCGEMAGSPFYVPVLLGLGAREFSINTNSIRSVSRLLSAISVADSMALVKTLEASETAKENEHRLREYYLENWKDFFPPGIIDSRHR